MSEAPKPDNLRIEQQTKRYEVPTTLTQDLMEIVFDSTKALACNDIRVLKIAFKILRAAFALACDELGVRFLRNSKQVEIDYVVAACRRIEQEKTVIYRTETFISNPLDKKS